MYIKYEEECDDRRQDVIDHDHNRRIEEKTEEIEDGEDRRRHGDRQTAISLCTAVLNRLSLGFKYVEEGQADQTAKHVAKENNNTQNRLNTAEIEDNCRQNAKTDHVAQRVELNSKALFVLGSVLLGTGNRAVKHIAKAGEHQAYYGKSNATVCRTSNAKHTGKQAYIGEDYRVIIKSDKFHIFSSEEVFLCLLSALSIRYATANPTAKQISEIMSEVALGNSVGMAFSEEATTNPSTARLVGA